MEQVFHARALGPLDNRLGRKAKLITRKSAGADEIYPPTIYMNRHKWLGTVFTIVLLVVIVITSVTLRGLWSVFVLVLLIAPVVGMVVNRLAGLVLPWTSKYLIDDVIGKHRADMLMPLAAIAAETEDRYGRIPESVEDLFDYARLRQAAEDVGVISIDRIRDGIAIKLAEKARVSPEQLMELIRAREGANFAPSGVLRLALSDEEKDEMLAVARRVLLQIKADS